MVAELSGWPHCPRPPPPHLGAYPLLCLSPLSHLVSPHGAGLYAVPCGTTPAP